MLLKKLPSLSPPWLEFTAQSKAGFLVISIRGFLTFGTEPESSSLTSALYIGPYIIQTKLQIKRWCGFAGMPPHTCLILLFRNVLSAYPCRTFTAVISQVTHSPLSALTFQFSSYLKKGSSSKWTAFDPLRHLFRKV